MHVAIGIMFCVPGGVATRSLLVQSGKVTTKTHERHRLSVLDWPKTDQGRREPMRVREAVRRVWRRGRIGLASREVAGLPRGGAQQSVRPTARYHTCRLPVSTGTAARPRPVLARNGIDVQCTAPRGSVYGNLHPHACAVQPCTAAERPYPHLAQRLLAVHARLGMHVRWQHVRVRQPAPPNACAVLPVRPPWPAPPRGPCPARWPAALPPAGTPPRAGCTWGTYDVR